MKYFFRLLSRPQLGSAAGPPETLRGDLQDLHHPPGHRVHRVLQGPGEQQPRPGLQGRPVSDGLTGFSVLVGKCKSLVSTLTNNLN